MLVSNSRRFRPDIIRNLLSDIDKTHPCLCFMGNVGPSTHSLDPDFMKRLFFSVLSSSKAQCRPFHQLPPRTKTPTGKVTAEASILASSRSPITPRCHCLLAVLRARQSPSWLSVLVSSATGHYGSVFSGKTHMVVSRLRQSWDFAGGARIQLNICLYRIF